MEKKTPTFDELIRMRVVHHVPGMDAVQRRRDLPYGVPGAEARRLDVYSPAGAPRPRPGVILIHGGPLPKTGAKNMGVFVSWGELLAASGFAAVTFDHRFLSPARLPDAAGDVAELIAHVRDHGEALGVDAQRLALWAFSGGGPFLAAALRDRPAWLRAVVAYYAVLDLQQAAPGAEAEIGAELRQRHSPLCALGDAAHGTPPMLVARAGLDGRWLNEGLERFVAAALAAGVTLDVLNHPAGRHAFDVLDDDARSRHIIRRTLAFLRDHLFDEP